MTPPPHYALIIKNILNLKKYPFIAERIGLNRIERAILASFEKANEQSLREVVDRTNIPKGTVKKYLSILVKGGQTQTFW